MIIKTGDHSLNGREDGTKVSVRPQDSPVNRTEILNRNNRSVTGGVSELYCLKSGIHDGNLFLRLWCSTTNVGSGCLSIADVIEKSGVPKDRWKRGGGKTLYLQAMI